MRRVPVTYPDAGDLLTFVRGHEAETEAAPQVDWARLAGLTGTIVCYAGAKQVGTVVQSLLAHGKSPDENAALIYDPTLPSQHAIGGTLGTIAAEAMNDAPALLVIGPVAGLREHLRWFDDRPLFGRRIVVTRSREQAGELIDMLEERGAEAIPSPTIRSAPRKTPSRWSAPARRPDRSIGSSLRARTASTISCSGCSPGAMCAISRG